ncbi:MAG: lamin tail domain-containing protein [Anaerolineales bacterium]|nr:lamin tail domain-containing protein [Anaerolineales bacterium]
MFRISKEIVLFVFVLTAGVAMSFANAKTYANPTNPLATPSNTPNSNYLPIVLNPAGTPTPTATATATATAAPSAADVRITYIEYDPPGSDVDGEYVDIQNMGGTTQNLAGWKLRDAASNSYTFPTFTLSPSAKVRVWTGSGTNSATDLYMNKGWSIWNNGGDTATLLDDLGQVVHMCTYVGGGSGEFCP